MQRFVIRSILLGGLALAACAPPPLPVPACRPLPPEAPQPPTPVPPDSLPDSADGSWGRASTSASFATGC